MKFLALAPLLGAICNFCLSIFVLASDRKSRLNQVFFAWGLCITIWNLGSYGLFLTASDDPGTALQWARFLQYGVIFIPVTLLHLSLLIAQVRVGRIIICLYLFQTGLAWLNANNLFIKGVRQLEFAWYSVAGPGFWIFLCTFSMTSVSIFILLRRRRSLPPLQRRRLSGLIIAQSLLVTLGTNDILPILGIDHYPYPFAHVAIYPYGSLAAVFYGIIIGYSVLQHQLLDVHVVLSRFAAHAVRFLFLFLIGLALQVTVSFCFPKEFNTVSFFGSLGVLMLSTLIATLLFPRLIGGRVEKLERRLLGDHFEYQDQVRSFIEGMSWYGDLDLLLNSLHDLFLRSFRLQSYQIILRDETNRTFSLFRAHPEELARQLPDLQPHSSMLRYFEWGKGEYLSLPRHRLRMSLGSIEREAGKQLEQLGAQFCFPLTSQSEPFGLLLVGKKNSDEPFTATDINLFVSLAKSMSLVVNQIRLKTQILQTQELDLLGRMSRGMAHDLNNLLTPVWTLLELSGESGERFDEELLPVAQRNIKTMRAYIREALFFSENLRLDLQLGRLDLVVQQAVELARASRDKAVEIIPVTPGEVLIEMDEVLLQRLIANLISNAIDASQPGTQIHVHLERLGRAHEQNWLRVRVVDQGEGISKENLGRIQKPYFTTKNRGDETRGFGLGLAISRKIVNLHGGHLSISSVLKKGTTVQVDLPSRRTSEAPPPDAVPA